MVNSVVFEKATQLEKVGEKILLILFHVFFYKFSIFKVAANICFISFTLKSIFTPFCTFFLIKNLSTNYVAQAVPQVGKEAGRVEKKPMCLYL